MLLFLTEYLKRSLGKDGFARSWGVSLSLAPNPRERDQTRPFLNPALAPTHKSARLKTHQCAPSRVHRRFQAHLRRCLEPS